MRYIICTDPGMGAVGTVYAYPEGHPLPDGWVNYTNFGSAQPQIRFYPGPAKNHCAVCADLCAHDDYLCHVCRGDDRVVVAEDIPLLVAMDTHYVSSSNYG